MRIHDNPLLHTIRNYYQNGHSTLLVYCFDPRHFEVTPFGSKKCGDHRANFLIESVDNLRSNLRKLGHDLLVCYGKPEHILLQLTSEQSNDVVIVQTEAAYEENQVEMSVEGLLASIGVTLIRLQSSTTLYALEDLPYSYPSLADMPDVFTPFKEKIEKGSMIRDLLSNPLYGELGSSPNTVLPSGCDCGFDYLPSLKCLYSFNGKSDTGTTSVLDTATSMSSPRGVMQFIGGEDAARQRLHDWMWRDDNLKDYFDLRNGMLGERYSSKLSPWLALGCISPRYIPTINQHNVALLF